MRKLLYGGKPLIPRRRGWWWLRKLICLTYGHKHARPDSAGYGRCHRCLKVLNPAFFRKKGMII